MEREWSDHEAILKAITKRKMEGYMNASIQPIG